MEWAGEGEPGPIAAPRILQVTTLPVTMRLFVLPLAEALAEWGYQVELAYGGPAAESFAPFPAYRVALSRNPLQPRNGWGLVQLLGLMRRRRYQAVHLHTPVAGLVGRLAAWLAGVPLVLYTLHGSFWDTRPRWRAALFDSLERLAGPWTSHAFALNEKDAADLIDRCGLQPEQVTPLPVGGAGVDLDRFCPDRFSPADRTARRVELGLAVDDMVIGYVGRIDRDKGLRELLEAVARLRRNHSRLRLLLIGQRLVGDRDAAIRSLLAELGQTVICPGFREDIPELVACMDVVVSASHRDGFGMLLAEAAAMAKPVVAAATRGTGAAVIDGQTGLVVPIGDVAALTQALESLITDQVRRNQLGEAALRLAQDRFGRSKLMEVYQETYQSLLREGTVKANR